MEFLSFYIPFSNLFSIYPLDPDSLLTEKITRDKNGWALLPAQPSQTGPSPLQGDVILLAQLINLVYHEVFC